MAERQLLGDLAVREAVDDEHRHIALAGGERREQVACDSWVLAFEFEDGDAAAVRARRGDHAAMQDCVRAGGENDLVTSLGLCDRPLP
jgi:hypothetical protein